MREERWYCDGLELIPTRLNVAPRAMRHTLVWLLAGVVYFAGSKTTNQGGTMKQLILIMILIGLTGTAVAADTYVNPYVRKDGTYVEGHWRTAPNDTRMDNYSTQGNTNPYTGQKGYVDPLKLPDPAPTYGTPRQKRSYGF